MEALELNKLVNKINDEELSENTLNFYNNLHQVYGLDLKSQYYVNHFKEVLDTYKNWNWEVLTDAYNENTTIDKNKNIPTSPNYSTVSILSSLNKVLISWVIETYNRYIDNHLVVTILKHNLIKQLYFGENMDDDDEWLTTILYDKDIEQLRFDRKILNKYLIYYKRTIEDLKCFVSLMFSHNLIPKPMYFLSIDAISYKEVPIKDIDKEFESEDTIKDSKNEIKKEYEILKEDVFLYDSMTGIKTLIAYQGCVLPLRINVALLPVASSGKFSCKFLLRETLLTEYDLNLINLDFTKNTNLNVEINITNHIFTSVLKYSTNEGTEEIPLSVEYDFACNDDDKTHFDYNVLRNKQSAYFKQKTRVESDILKSQPFTFKEWLVKGESLNTWLFNSDIIDSFLFMCNYNLLNSDKKIDLKKYIVYNERELLNNRNFALVKNSDNFNDSKIINNWDIQYLNRDLDTMTALKLVQVHAKGIKKWRKKLGYVEPKINKQLFGKIKKHEK